MSHPSRRRALPALLPLLSCLPLLAACAGDVHAPYPRPAGAGPTGALTVLFTEEVTSVSVIVDDVLVVEDEHTGRVEVTGVPAGRREVEAVAASGSRTAPIHLSRHVEVEPGETATLLVAVPPHSTGWWIQAAAWSVGAWVAWMLLD